MFGDMMGKLQEAQKKVEETKQRMKTITVQEKGPEGKLVCTVTASGNIHQIDIPESLLEDREQLEDYLVLTLNKALDKAREIQDSELAAAARNGIPNIPGL
jgi:DNA-binding protein YbaB